jgi:hypothetical protein
MQYDMVFIINCNLKIFNVHWRKKYNNMKAFLILYLFLRKNFMPFLKKEMSKNPFKWSNEIFPIFMLVKFLHESSHHFSFKGD